MNVRSRNRSFFPRFRQGAAPLGWHPVEKRDSLFANGLRETVFAVKCFLAQSSQAENCVDCYFGCIARRYLFRILLCAGLLVGASTRLALGEGPQSFAFETTLQPVVNEPVHEYLNVTFQPGDQIFLNAGGCVQTGGFGATWKRYVDPSGEAADRLYHGLVFIPGVTPGLVRIGGVINRPLDVPTYMGSWPPLRLTLGYEDSDGGYGNNGYYDHDDGTENQCKGVGPAWVTVRIKRGVNAVAGTANQTGNKYFDLRWDTPDPNGYPFNPRWYYAASNQMDIRDPKRDCNGFAWTQQGVDSGPDCVSLKLSNDSVGYWKDFVPGLCENDGPIRGHVNWGEVTYEAPVRFVKFDMPELSAELSPGIKVSPKFPFVKPNAIHIGEGDDDVNLALYPLHVANAPIMPDDHAQFDNPNDIDRDIGSILLEFDSDETIDYFHGSTWWQNFISNPLSIENDVNGRVVGKDAVVTGILGLDFTHGITTEIHPVHAIAIRTKEEVEVETGRLIEEWGYFVRNWGNEGECSQERLHPAPFPQGDYIFRLPWRKGMDLDSYYRGEWTSNGLPLRFFPSQSIIRDANGMPKAVAIEFDGFPKPEQRAWVAGSFSLAWKPLRPQPSAISHLVVTPIGRHDLIVARQAQLSGVVRDASDDVIDGVTLDLTTTVGSLSPSSVRTGVIGSFTSIYTAPIVPGIQTVTAATSGAPTRITSSVTVAVHPDVTTLSPNIGDVTGRSSATILGAGFISGDTGVNVEPLAAAVPRAAAPVSAAAYDNIQLGIPRSPLPGDGDGIGCVFVTVANVASECLYYHYVVPGKPVLAFTYTSCDSGTIVASVFAADGSRQTVPIRFSAPYNAFRGVSGTYVQSLTVNSGDFVTVIGTGPITATNAQSPTLTATETYATFSPNVCPNLRVITAGIDPRWAAFNPDQLKPVPLGPCPGPECPGGEAGSAILWQNDSTLRNSRLRVNMTDANPAVVNSKFRVATVGDAALRAYILAHPYAAVFGASKKAKLLFAGPAVSIMGAGKSATDVSRFDERCRIDLPLPATAAKPSQYRIVHLAPAGKALAWIEEATAELGTKGKSLAIATRETGVFALVRVVE